MMTAGSAQFLKRYANVRLIFFDSAVSLGLLEIAGHLSTYI